VILDGVLRDVDPETTAPNPWGPLRTVATRDVNRNLAADLHQATHILSLLNHQQIMANRGYDVVVDVDQEVCKM
jgi:starch phosphorylase